MFLRKGPSDLEIARENEIKISITQELASALKSVQKENIDSQDQAVYSTDTANQVCNCIEAVFLHGLRSKAVTKIASYVGLGQEAMSQPSLNFWSFVSRFTHGEVIAQLKHLGQITTEIGLCRAWVRVALNDGIMESYIDAMVADKKTLERHYHRTAYLLDPEQPGIMKTYLQGLMNFDFKLSYNASVLNEWSYPPLLLAGVIDTKDAPPPVIKPPTSKPAKTAKPSTPAPDPNTVVEVIQEGWRSRGSSQNSDLSGSPKNPMDQPKFGRPSGSSYYISTSEFTSKDVEDFKRLSKDVHRPVSECSSSSLISAPDPPHMNASPAAYVQKYRVATYSPPSSVKSDSSTKNVVVTEQGKDNVASVKESEIDVNTDEGILDELARVSQLHKTEANSLSQEEIKEGDNEIREHSEKQELEESWENFYKSPVKKIQKEDLQFRKTQRMDSINRDAKEEAILNSFVDSDEGSKQKNVKNDDKLSCYSGGKHVNINEEDFCKKDEISLSAEDACSSLLKKYELDVKEPEVTELSKTGELLHASEKLLTEIGFEDSVVANAPVIAVPSGSPVKKIGEKSAVDKLKPQLSLSPPKSEIVKPELSDTVADKVDQIRTLENPQYLSKHRLSLPNTGQLHKPERYGKRKSLPNVLETQEMGDSRDEKQGSIEDHLYDGMPLDEGEGHSRSPVSDTDTLDDIEIKEDQEIRRGMGNKRNSVGNNLMMTGRGWSSSFESEAGDTVDAFSPPRCGLSVPISRPKTESFGSLLQNYTPTSSLTARSVDDVLSNFPSSKDVVVSPSLSDTNEQMRENLEGFEVVTNESTDPDSDDLSCILQFSSIANEKGLDAQNFHCKGCSRAIGLIFGKPRVCKFDGGYYCYECHENDEFYIPALIIHNWDFRKHKVSKKNLNFLMEKEEQPYINLEEANQRLYDHVDEMKEIQGLRKQLTVLKTYLFTCKQSIAEDLRKLIWPRDYLYESTELYSLSDLLQVPTGALASSLRKVIKFASKHVYSCRLCSQKGFICELCSNPKVIYPFEVEATYRCPQCKTVFHKECKTDNRPCPKCQRRLMRQTHQGDLDTALTPQYDLQTA